jgi:hypothetical protein
VWRELLGHKDKRHVHNVLEWIEINMSMSKMEGFSDLCVLGKAHRKPFTPRSDRAQVISVLIKTYVYGSMSAESLRGSKYCVHCVLLQQVSQGVPQAIQVFIMFLNEVSTAGHAVKEFRCYGGKELAYEEFVVP